MDSIATTKSKDIIQGIRGYQKSISSHLEIVNFFHNRATNAASESFNAKIKAFRRVFRVVKDKAFFLFRVCKLYT